jgi:hypothetical protein
MELRAAHGAMVAALWRLRNGDGGWPYYAGRKSRIEATCWAALGTGVPVTETPLASWMGPTGLLIESQDLAPNFAFNAMAALVASTDVKTTSLARTIVEALVARRGEVLPPSPVTRVNTSLVGWSWSAGTFSWVEPTAWCLLALKRSGRGVVGAEARIASAVDLMRDRACRGGGWNFGSNEVLGTPLAPYVSTTAVGVLALQDQVDQPFVQEAVNYLERDALSEHSTTALALSALALAAVRRPARLVVETLAKNVAQAEALGNAAAIGMASHALESALNNTPSALSVTARPQ